MYGDPKSRISTSETLKICYYGKGGPRLRDFVENWRPFSEQMWLNHDACQQNLTSRNSPADPADPPDPADPADPPETESGRAEQTLGSSRRGAG